MIVMIMILVTVIPITMVNAQSNASNNKIDDTNKNNLPAWSLGDLAARRPQGLRGGASPSWSRRSTSSSVERQSIEHESDAGEAQRCWGGYFAQALREAARIAAYASGKASTASHSKQHVSSKSRSSVSYLPAARGP